MFLFELTLLFNGVFAVQVNAMCKSGMFKTIHFEVHSLYNGKWKEAEGSIFKCGWKWI
jgi:hypothetical protein